ncbi:MAG: GAF domain-containing protein [Elainellaceae cyanobacterium]
MTRAARTVLIIDDSPEDRELYRRYLTRDPDYCYTLLEADLGEQGLALWKQHQPDVVLLDYRLPDLDGLEFLARLECLPHLPYFCSSQKLTFPVIMVTGQGNEAIAVRALKAGAQDYLVKGRITLEGLHLAVNSAISTVQLRAQLQQRIERERLVSEITRKVHQTLDLDHVLQTSVEEVRRFLQTDRVVLFRLYPDGQGTVVTESVGAAWSPTLKQDFFDPCLSEEHIEPFCQGHITLKSDIYDGSIDPCHIQLLERLQVRANLVVPILQNGHLWGMLIAHHCSETRQWQPLEIDLLKDIAAQVGIALQQAELYRQAQIEISERRRVEAELRESEERLRLAQRAAGAGLWDWNLLDNQVAWSQECYQLYGLPKSEPPSYAGWLGAILKADRDRVNGAILDALEHNTGLNIEFRISHPSRGICWLMVIGQTLYGAEEYPIRMTGITLDITSRKRSEAALEHRAKELTRLNYMLKQITADLDQRNKDLNQFAYVVSHDLKAPLRGIQNLSQWLQEDLGDLIPPDNQNQLKLLSNRVVLMETLINDLLNYSRAGRVKQPPEQVDISRLLLEVVSTLSVPPGVIVRVATPLPTLQVKRMMLGQVFANLISNAIKYGCAQGRGEITVSAWEQPDGYQFAVADKGPGIAPSYHGKIFGVFETLQPKQSASESGSAVISTGIGLAIVERLVTAEGGKIWVESDVDAGATFFFTWKSARPSALLPASATVLDADSRATPVL